MAACSKGGDCNPVHHSETATDVTHRCTKCGTLYTRPKGRAARAERVGRAYAVAFLVMVCVCVAATIWAGGTA